jgi:hypothetical protein
MCEFCGCGSGISARDRTNEQIRSERKPVHVRIVAATAPAESEAGARERREEAQPAETAAV